MPLPWLVAQSRATESKVARRILRERLRAIEADVEVVDLLDDKLKSFVHRVGLGEIANAFCNAGSVVALFRHQAARRFRHLR